MTGAYGGALGQCYRLSAAPAVVTRTRGAIAAATRLETEGDEPFTTDGLPYEDAFLVNVMLRPFPKLKTWEEGRALPEADVATGQSLIQDLRRDPRSLVDRPLDAVTFYLPQSILDESGRRRSSAAKELDYEPGQPMTDQVLRGLATSIRAALERPNEVSQLYLDQVVLAAAAHVAFAFGRNTPDLDRGGLAPWQVRRARDMLLAQLDAPPALEAVAQACGLSIGHFSRAFTTSLGAPPHRWLLGQRVEGVKALLGKGELSLAEIATQCGFADQSHMNRVFARWAGISPGRWRKAKLN